MYKVLGANKTVHKTIKKCSYQKIKLIEYILNGSKTHKKNQLMRCLYLFAQNLKRFM